MAISRDLSPAMSDLILQFSQLLLALLAALFIVLFGVVGQLLHVRLNLVEGKANSLANQVHAVYKSQEKSYVNDLNDVFMSIRKDLFGKQLHNTMIRKMITDSYLHWKIGRSIVID